MAQFRKFQFLNHNHKSLGFLPISEIYCDFFQLHKFVTLLISGGFISRYIGLELIYKKKVHYQFGSNLSPKASVGPSPKTRLGPNPTSNNSGKSVLRQTLPDFVALAISPPPSLLSVKKIPCLIPFKPR